MVRFSSATATNFSFFRSLVIAVALCTGAAHSLVVQAETVMRVGTGSDLKIPDPVFTTAHQSRDHGYMVYDTLFGVDADMKIQPQMLENWKVADDKMSIRMTLREGLKFHDGKPVTSADVIASIDRWSRADSMAKLAIKTVADIKADGDRTVVLTLAEKSTIIIDAMGKPSGQVLFIMPERLAKTPVTEQVSESIGSGPFTFDKAEWIPGQKRTYRRFADYKPRSEPTSNLAGSRKALVDTVEFIVLPDDATRQAAIIAGEVDFVADISADLLPILEAEKDLVTKPTDIRGEQLWLRMNQLIPPFDNVKARQAVLWAVSQMETMQTVIGNPKLFTTCFSMWGCGTPFSTTAGSEALQKQDLEKAKALLKESGYDGREVVLLDPTNYALLHNANLRSAETLRKIGLNVKLQGIAVSELGQKRTNKGPVGDGGWNIFHTTFPTIDVSDPVRNPAINASCDQTNWPGWPCNQEIEALRKQFFSASDPKEQAKLAEQIQVKGFEFVTHIPLGVFFKVHSWSKKLQGVQESSVPVFWGISKK